VAITRPRARGWASVEIHGSPEFRRATGILLQELEPPVAVADSPLGDADLARIEALRHAQLLPMVRSLPQELGPGHRPRAGTPW